MKRILFIDDEPQILDALQDSLRGHRRRWDMTFVCGGEEAVAELLGSTYDVVVSDVRMPRVNGVDVLKYAKENNPNAIRIALTGFADQKSTIELTTLAQRYLTKPCVVEELDEVITRDLGLIDAFDNKRVQEIAGSSGRLPANDVNTRQLIERLDSSDGNIDEIAGIVEQDIAMTAKILQLANSSFFRRQQSVVSAKQAISFLGLDVLRSLVLANQMFNETDELPKVACFDPKALYEHSVLTSTIARDLFPDDNATSFTAGLLHDVGKFVILKRHPELVPVLTHADSNVPNLWVSNDKQREILGCTQSEVGAYILNLWGIPTDIIEAIVFHDNPENIFTREFDAVGAIHVSNYLAHWVNAGEDCEHIESKLNRDYLEQMGVSDKIDGWKLAAKIAVTGDDEPLVANG